jgi:uncharacterized peroxidase-related enzyme
MRRPAFLAPRLDRPATSAAAPSEPIPPPPACNFLQLLAHSPAVIEAYRAYDHALAQGQLTPQQREMIALTVAEINGSKYGLSAHYAAAKAAGLSEEEIRLARQAAASDPRQTALLRFTRAVALQRGEVSDADFQALRSAGFNDAQVTEIVANIALNIFSNYFNSVARTEVDFPILEPGAEAPK